MLAKRPLYRFFFLLSVAFWGQCILCHYVLAQSQSDHFGKNRIQHKRFDWTYYKSDNFEVYFYKEGSEIARFATLHAEEEYKRISKIIGYAPFGKTKLLLYNSHSDLLQSNIGLDDEVAFVGGQTNFVKLNAELAFNGNLIEYKDDISVSIARIYITDLIYGGSIKEVYQNALLVHLPDWFISGAAAYVGKGWSLEMDDYMRDAVFRYNLRNPAKFRGKEAELIGQSIFNFMVAKYGEPQIANIISLSRIMRNDREAIEATLNVSYRQFIKEWRQYYKDMATKTLESYKMPDKASRVKKHNHRKMDYNKVKISPNGNYLAYTQNKKGRYAVKLTKIKEEKETAQKGVVERKPPAEEIKLSDIDRELGITEDTTKSVKNPEPPKEEKRMFSFGRKRTMMRGGLRLVNQKVNYNVPLITWKNNNHLAVLVKKKNRHILRTYNSLGFRKSRTKIYNFNQILDFSYSHDDNFLVISAERNGQSDIFIYDTRRATTKVVTNDMYDDLFPVFQKGTKNVVWSSNRHNDTLGVDAGRFRLLGSNLNLFRYEPDNGSVLTRLTNYPGDEVKPLSYDNQTLVYLSDETGIIAAHRLNLADTAFSTAQLTNNAQSFRDYDVSAKESSITYVSVSKGKERVQYESLNLHNDLKVEKTERQLQMELVEEQKEQKVDQNRQEAVKVVSEKLRLEKESQKLEELVEAIMQGTMSDSSITKLAQDTAVSVLDLDSMHNQTFVFESEKNTIKATEGIEYRRNLGIKSDLYYLYKSDFQVFASKGGLWKARHRLGVENTVTSIAFDPLRGFGVVINATLADMFNDHRFYGGMFGSSDLRTSNIFLEYQYLKKRIDFRFRYEKQRLYVTDGLALPHKYTVNRWEAEASLPLTGALRVSIAPFFMNSRFAMVGPTNYNTAYGLPDQLTNYLGYRTEVVYDNALVVGHNMQEGTKFRLLYEYNYAFSTMEQNYQKQPTLDFGRVFADIRKYQRLHQELLLALRFSGGAFLGPAKKSFLLGGMDNWIGASTENREDPQSPMYIDYSTERRDWLFNKYVTGMRGFGYNQQYGSNYLLFNAELRWPIIQYFYRGVIGSNFLKNLQLTGFYDLGSAWTGVSPWDEENSFNTKYVDQSKGGFTAYVTNYRNPWLQGLGTGLRTMFLGYYLKVDLAWGIYDYVVQKPRWYVTLGYDF